MNIMESTRATAAYTGNVLSATGRYLARTVVRIGDLTGINSLINAISKLLFGNRNQTVVAPQQSQNATATVTNPPSTGVSNNGVALAIFDALGVDPHAKCEHGLPVYTCMSCSH